MSTTRSYPLGVTFQDDGVNVAFHSETADMVDFCVFDAGSETRHRSTHKDGHVFHDAIPGIRPGARYGIRVDGPWALQQGLRHNSRKLLLDPHARLLDGAFGWRQELFGHDFTDPARRNDLDSAAAMPKCVVIDPSFEWSGDRGSATSLADSIMYSRCSSSRKTATCSNAACGTTGATTPSASSPRTMSTPPPSTR